MLNLIESVSEGFPSYFSRAKENRQLKPGRPEHSQEISDADQIYDGTSNCFESHAGRAKYLDLYCCIFQHISLGTSPQLLPLIN